MMMMTWMTKTSMTTMSSMSRFQCTEQIICSHCKTGIIADNDILVMLEFLPHHGGKLFAVFGKKVGV